MTDDIIAAIDAVVGCQTCGGPLGNSPDPHFCSELCHGVWATMQADPALSADAPETPEDMWERLAKMRPALTSHQAAYVEGLIRQAETIRDTATAHIRHARAAGNDKQAEWLAIQWPFARKALHDG